MMRVLFLDQSGQLGGAELALLDLVPFFAPHGRVVLFSDGPFGDRLTTAGIPVTVLSDRALQFKKSSSWLQGLKVLGTFAALVRDVVRLSGDFDCIYANTQKALVVGAIASLLTGRPLVYHLHDIISPDHFSPFNQRLILTCARRAALVIANSQASRKAYQTAGASLHQPLVIVHNGFNPAAYHPLPSHTRLALRESFGFATFPSPSPTSVQPSEPFIVGHFSRLSPWKGQHILLDALSLCPSPVVALFVGEALFGESDYAQSLREQIQQLGLGDRVKFLGFRSDIPQIMAACDLVAHTSTAPEPFGRVIVEAMLSGTPVIAAAAGGALEILQQNQTGWLTAPGNAQALAKAIRTVYESPSQRQAIAQSAQQDSLRRFNLATINQQIYQALQEHLPTATSVALDTIRDRPKA